MADIKELIPEFFYLPEFLTNQNKFEFGTKQNGEVLDDIVLPPWAKNDPREFIRLHRKVLWKSLLVLFCLEHLSVEGVSVKVIGRIDAIERIGVIISTDNFNFLSLAVSWDQIILGAET